MAPLLPVRKLLMLFLRLVVGVAVSMVGCLLLSM